MFPTIHQHPFLFSTQNTSDGINTLKASIQFLCKHRTAAWTFHCEASFFLFPTLAICSAGYFQTCATRTGHSTKWFVILIVPHGGFNTPLVASTNTWYSWHRCYWRSLWQTLCTFQGWSVMCLPIVLDFRFSVPSISNRTTCNSFQELSGSFFQWRVVLKVIHLRLRMSCPTGSLYMALGAIEGIIADDITARRYV